MPHEQAITNAQFAWIMLTLIAIMVVFIIGMLKKMWDHETKPTDDFKRRHGIDDNY